MSYLDILWKVARGLLILLWVIVSAGFGIDCKESIENSGPHFLNISGLIACVISFLCAISYIAYKLQ